MSATSTAQEGKKVISLTCLDILTKKETYNSSLAQKKKSFVNLLLIGGGGEEKEDDAWSHLRERTSPRGNHRRLSLEGERGKTNRFLSGWEREKSKVCRFHAFDIKRYTLRNASGFSSEEGGGKGQGNWAESKWEERKWLDELFL